MSEELSAIPDRLAIALGNAHMAAGQYDEAETEFQHALAAGLGRELDPYSILRARLARGDYSGARQIVRESPFVSEGILASIDVLEQTPIADLDRAISWCDQAIDNHPYNHFWAGLVKFGANLTEAAAGHFTTFLHTNLSYPSWQWMKMKWEKQTCIEFIARLRDIPPECHFCAGTVDLTMAELHDRTFLICLNCALLTMDEVVWRKYVAQQIDDPILLARLKRLAATLFGDDPGALAAQVSGESVVEDSVGLYPSLQEHEVDASFDSASMELLDLAAVMAGEQGKTCIESSHILQIMLRRQSPCLERLMVPVAAVHQVVEKLTTTTEPCAGRYSEAVLSALSIARWNNVLSRRPAPQASEKQMVEGLVWSPGGQCGALLRELVLPEDLILSTHVNLLTMSSAQMAFFEAMLDKDPSNLYVRLVLLSFKNKPTSSQVAEHSLWLTQNWPRYRLSTSSTTSLECRDSVAYVKTVQLWRGHLQDYPDDPAILARAGDLFFLPEDRLAEELLKRGLRLSGDGQKWSKRLSELYSLRMAGLQGAPRQQQARQALQIQEDVLRRTADDGQRLSTLREAARLALEAGELDAAERYSRTLINLSEELQPNWDSGNGVHHGHIVLGRLAVQRGDTSQAGIELLAAGRTPGSPQLNSFGPNMGLASHLLQAGQKDVVLEYLALCRTFWVSGRDALDQWIAAIEGGQAPDFGANSGY